MTQSADADGESVHREYIAGVRIVERPDGDFRFEAPRHCGRAFENSDTAELYADVYFDVNGFEEDGTGERGVPPVIIQAGRDTLAAYFCTQQYTDRQWVASFMGVKHGKVERYVSRVRKRARSIRSRAADHEGVAGPDDAGTA